MSAYSRDGWIKGKWTDTGPIELHPPLPEGAALYPAGLFAGLLQVMLSTM
jgi:hypothetical protein